MRPLTGDAECAWLRVADEVMEGIHHEVSNRVAAVSAVAQLIEDRGVLGDTLRLETRRLERMLHLLRLLARVDDLEPRAVHLPDLLPDLFALLDVQREEHAPECEVEGAEILPVYAAPRPLMHALLTLLVRAGHTAAETGAGLCLRYGGDARTVTIRVTPGVAAPDRDAVEAMLRPAGAEVRGDSDGVELRLPTLPEARRLGTA